MSVTFFIPGSPTETSEVSCLCAQMAPRFCDHFDGIVSSDEIRDELREYASKECLSCKGEGMIVEDSPVDDTEVNFANSNARAFLRLMGFSGDLEGEVKTGDIPGVMRNLIRVVNSQGTRGAFVEEAFFVPPVSGHMIQVSDGDVVRLKMVGGSSAIHYGGRSDDQIIIGANQLISMFRKAQEYGSDVFWS